MFTLHLDEQELSDFRIKLNTNGVTSHIVENQASGKFHIEDTGVKLLATYNKAAEELTVQVLKHPFWIPKKEMGKMIEHIFIQMINLEEDKD